MKATFIGHQTWLIEEKSTKILIDPLIREDFGLIDEQKIDIYPPRKVDELYLSDVDVIFLSHEHADHFDIDSLNLLPRTAKFIVGCTLIEPVKNCIKNLGFDLLEIDNTKPHKFKELNIRFYPADPQTAFWESRVTQIHIESDSNRKDGIFIAVDALVSKDFIDDLEQGIIENPRLVIVSNNSRTSPPGAFQSLENWGKNTALSNKKIGPLGVGVISSVVTSYLKILPKHPENIAFCGGGFVKRIGDFAAFPFSEQKDLSIACNKLSLDVNIIGLIPGEVIEFNESSLIESKSDWITLDKDKHEGLKSELDNFINEGKKVNPLGSVAPDYKNRDRFENDLLIARSELNAIARDIMLSLPGKQAIKIKNTQPRRIAFVFRSENLSEIKIYALNFISGNFEEDTISDETTVMKIYPFGINIPLIDFIAMKEGRLQIWDIVGVSIKSWFKGGIFGGLIPFLYCYYGENANPKLLEKIIQNKMRTLE